MTIEAEIAVMQLQAKEPPDLGGGKEGYSPEPSEVVTPVSSLISDFWPVRKCFFVLIHQVCGNLLQQP